MNPKTVSGDELYGYMTLSKDWKDGCLSIIMRGMAKNFAEQSFLTNTRRINGRSWMGILTPSGSSP